MDKFLIKLPKQKDGQPSSSSSQPFASSQVVPEVQRQTNFFPLSNVDNMLDLESLEANPKDRMPSSAYTPNNRDAVKRSSKRLCDDFWAETPRKKPARVSRIQLDSDEEVGTNEEKVFYFRVLLPNGITLELQVRGPPSEMPVQDFVILVRREYQNLGRRTESPKPKRQINWTSKDLHFVDAFENRITKMLDFRNFKSNQSHMLRLCDGLAEADEYENMWDLTPDTDLLRVLPEEYTFETALADLIDNSLQAVWSNHADHRRLISLELTKNRITIFDTGPGMDGSAENSIVKWGKMGASLHRLSRDRGIGGKPPYLMPYFGMFGYGGPIASMHLGRRASVSSKTKECKKVFVLHLERETLLRCSSSQKTWRTDGKVRDPLEDELRDSTRGSFTKVEIFHPKMRTENLQKLQHKLKDIYFPYIQCDDVSKRGKTMMPIEFQIKKNEKSACYVLSLIASNYVSSVKSMCSIFLL